VFGAGRATTVPGLGWGAAVCIYFSNSDVRAI
jgi:hypothetical protein